MRKSKQKRVGLAAFWIAGLVFFGSVNAFATVVFNDTFDIGAAPTLGNDVDDPNDIAWTTFFTTADTNITATIEDESGNNVAEVQPYDGYDGIFADFPANTLSANGECLDFSLRVHQEGTPITQNGGFRITIANTNAAAGDAKGYTFMNNWGDGTVDGVAQASGAKQLGTVMTLVDGGDVYDITGNSFHTITGRIQRIDADTLSFTYGLNGVDHIESVSVYAASLNTGTINHQFSFNNISIGSAAVQNFRVDDIRVEKTVAPLPDTSVTVYSEDFSSGVGSWLCNGGSIYASGGYLNVTPTADYKTTYSPYFNGAMTDLTVGKKVTLSFDVKQGTVSTGSTLRFYLLDQDSNVGYGVQTSLGGEVSLLIGQTGSQATAPSPSTTYYSSGSIKPAVVSDTAFENYALEIGRVATNQLSFSVYRNDGLLASVTNTYDDVEQPVAEMYLDFRRIFIGWTSVSDDGGTIEIDNARLSLDDLPTPELPAPPTLWETTYSEDFSSGTGSWLCNGGTIDASSGYLNVTPSADYKTVYSPYFDNALPSDLAVGQKVSLSFDVKRDTAVAGSTLRFYLTDQVTYNGYGVQASLGGEYYTQIGKTGSQATAPTPAGYYTSSPANETVVSDTVFENYVLEIGRVADDQLGFALYRNDGLIASITNTYDDIDQPSAEMYLDFRRIFIGWTGVSDDAASFQIDNVSIAVYTPLPEATFEAWADEHELTGADRELDADLEPDGMDNLMEYALGGDPEVADSDSMLPIDGMVSVGGTNWLVYVYNRHTNHVERTLVYTVQSTADLAAPAWAGGSPVEEVGVGAAVDGFEPVTNRLDTSLSTGRFLRLHIQQN